MTQPRQSQPESADQVQSSLLLKYINLWLPLVWGCLVLYRAFWRLYIGQKKLTK